MMRSPPPDSDPIARKLASLIALCQDVAQRIQSGDPDYQDDAALAVQMLFSADPAAITEFLSCENGVHLAVAAITKFSFSGLPRRPPCEWTCSIVRTSHGVWRSSFWLLPRFEERIQGFVEGADRMRTVHASFFNVYGQFVHRIRERRLIDATHEAMVAQEKAGNAAFEERLRLQEEYVRLEAERRRTRARQDADWDAAAAR